MVFLRLHPYRQQSIFRRASQKLSSKLYGSYPIEERVEKVTYKLKLPEGSKIHPVFHISLLKKKVGDSHNVTIDLPLAADDDINVLKPEAILDTRWVKKGSRFVEKRLIKWKRLPMDDATWEATTVLQDQFFNMNLEDKVPVIDKGLQQLAATLSRRLPPARLHLRPTRRTQDVFSSLSHLFFLLTAPLQRLSLGFAPVGTLLFSSPIASLVAALGAAAGRGATSRKTALAARAASAGRIDATDISIRASSTPAAAGFPVLGGGNRTMSRWDRRGIDQLWKKLVHSSDLEVVGVRWNESESKWPATTWNKGSFHRDRRSEAHVV
ncbi:hypothetical protein ZIOFF_003739 [Zingiber officinale]|uniref:Chromo domain-containing protein n=1 Tax=Zingiber officinale TaxID=94328 RepID=A0A8J5IDT0_ZINOF|nr:hypothetical protein ZIOFF_003739 [Zingiber officinale]